MKFTQDFRRDFAEIRRAVAEGERFVFTRYGTGEKGVIEGRMTHARGSGWVFKGGDSEYRRALDASWRYAAEGWYIGASCPCCNPVEFTWYWKHLPPTMPRFRMTFATLFMGANWPLSRDWAIELRKRGWLLIGPRMADITVPENVMEPTEFDYEPVLNTMLRTDKPFLLCAGPLAKILAWKYWSHPASPRQSIIDLGSILDLEMFGKPTRIYLQPKWVTRARTPEEKAIAKRRNAIVGRCCIWKLAKSPIHKKGNTK